ncbi:MAG: hypothetical protein EBV15_03935 [Bacteroidetes bacterium]|jgi:hypothetical protein|nr:hypothetical protein [Bacteroidota bacterium]
MKENPSVYVPVLRDYARLGNPVKHDRFLWHVTYFTKVSTLLIGRRGIALPLRGAVYAHNALPTFDAMYPYFVDCVDWFYPVHRNDGAQFDDYAFWRIDTHLCKFPWYLDPGMKEDSKFLGMEEHNYLCTPNAIPPEALSLFRFDMDNYRFRNPKIRFIDGCAHIRPIRSDFDTLVPCDEFNNFIRKRAA